MFVRPNNYKAGHVSRISQDRVSHGYIQPSATTVVRELRFEFSDMNTNMIPIVGDAVMYRSHMHNNIEIIDEVIITKFAKRSFDSMSGKEIKVTETKIAENDARIINKLLRGSSIKQLTKPPGIIIFDNFKNSFLSCVDAISSCCDKYICALLNTSGGTIYFGVAADGMIFGTILTRQQRDEIRRHIDDMTYRFTPSVSSQQYSIVFMPVGLSVASSTQATSEYYVVAIKVENSRDKTEYKTAKSEVWTYINEKVVQKVAQPIVSPQTSLLTNELLDSLISMGYEKETIIKATNVVLQHDALKSLDMYDILNELQK
jgi:hypothetical protein